MRASPGNHGASPGTVPKADLYGLKIEAQETNDQGEGIFELEVAGRTVVVLAEASTTVRCDATRSGCFPRGPVKRVVHIVLCGARSCERLVDVMEACTAGFVCWTSRALWRRVIEGPREGEHSRLRTLLFDFGEADEAIRIIEPAMWLNGTAPDARRTLVLFDEPLTSDRVDDDGIRVYLDGRTVAGGGPILHFTTGGKHSGITLTIEIAGCTLQVPRPESSEPTNQPPMPYRPPDAPIVGRKLGNVPPARGGLVTRRVDSQTRHEPSPWCLGVCIFCGAASRERGAVTPGRVIAVGGTLKPILMWHIERLVALAAQWGRPLAVLLMVSHETRDEVVDLLDGGFRIRRDTKQAGVYFIDASGKPSIRIDVCQQPLLHLNPSDEPAGPDGSWPLRIAGHLDFLDMSRGWLQRLGEASPEHVFAFGFNNLGHGVLEGDTLSRVVQAWTETKAPVGVELFEASANEWHSYVHKDRLIKRHYGIDGSIGRTKPVWISGHNWLFTAAFLQQPIDEEHLRTLVPAPPAAPGGGDGWPRFDLEQLTFGGKTRVVGLQIGALDPEGAARARYVMARTEDDLRSERIAHSLREGGSRDEHVQSLRERLLCRVEGVDVPNVWGGTLISALDQHGTQRFIGERWALSTHGAGSSTVSAPNTCAHDAAVVHGSLASDRQDEPTDTRSAPVRLVVDDLSFMLKVLDCQRPLSVQVHPTQAALNALKTSGVGLLRADSAEKEKTESFIVLRSAPPRGTDQRHFNLVLGFSREALQPIADALRRVLSGAVPQGDAEWTTLIGDVHERLWEALQQSHDAWKMHRSGLAGWPQPESRKAGACALYREALKFHLGGHAESPASYAALPDKAFLLAAIGVLRLLQLVGDTLATMEQSDQRGAREGGWLKDFDRCPLLRYFNRVHIPENHFVRIPPGCIHAWQGGGNLLIEASDCSDITYRVADNGRELDRATRRAMHHSQAMFAISDDAILDADHIGHLGARAVDGHVTDFHPNLQVRPMDDRLSTDAASEGGKQRWDWLMNPDGPVDLLASRGDKIEFLTLEPARVAMCARGIDLRVFRKQASHRVFLFEERRKPRPRGVVSLGVAKIEVAWRDGTEASGYWEAAGADDWQDAKGASEFERACRIVAGVARRLAQRVANRLGQTTEQPEGWSSAAFQIGWPGPIVGGTAFSSWLENHGLDDLREQLKDALRVSRAEQIEIRSDATAMALAEEKHRFGGLSPGGRGLIVNCDSGVCVAAVDERRAIDGGDDKGQTYEGFGAAGRYLMVDLRTGDVGLRDRTARGQALFDHVISAVKDPDEPPDERSGSRIRLSHALSIWSLAIRLGARLPPFERVRYIESLSDGAPPEQRKPFTETFTEAIGRLVDGARTDEVLRDNPPTRAALLAMNRGAFIAKVVDPGEAARAVRALVLEVATVLAGVLDAIEGLMRQYAEHRRDPSKVIPPDACRDVILTGTLGRSFGYIGEEDVLLSALEALAPTRHFGRTRFPVASLAELDGFDPEEKT